MKTLITIFFLLFFSITFSQTLQLSDTMIELTVKYKPATITIVSNGFSFPTNVNNVGRITFKDIKPGFYKFFMNGPRQPAELIDSIWLKAGKQLIANIKTSGPCLYDHAMNYIPKCPENHTDHIIPIIYGLTGEKIDSFITDSSKEKVRYAGCVTTECDPYFYCKIHCIEF